MKKTTKEMKMYKGVDTKGGEFFFPDKDDANAKLKIQATNVKQVTHFREDDSDLEQIQKGKMVQLNKYFEDTL